MRKSSITSEPTCSLALLAPHSLRSFVMIPTPQNPDIKAAVVSNGEYATILANYSPQPFSHLNGTPLEGKNIIGSFLYHPQDEPFANEALNDLKHITFVKNKHSYLFDIDHAKEVIAYFHYLEEKYPVEFEDE